MRIDRGRYSILFYHHSVNFPSCRSTNHYLCILRMVCMEHKFHRKRQLCALHRRGSSQDVLCNEHEAHNTKRSIAAAFFPHLHGARTHCAPNDTHNYLFLFFLPSLLSSFDFVLSKNRKQSLFSCTFFVRSPIHSLCQHANMKVLIHTNAIFSWKFFQKPNTHDFFHVRIHITVVAAYNVRALRQLRVRVRHFQSDDAYTHTTHTGASCVSGISLARFLHDNASLSS